MSTDLTRRQYFFRMGGGFANLALLDLMSRAQAATAKSPLAAKPSHFAAKAKRCVFLFMNGAPSHVDTFDPKPELTKFDGTSYKGKLTVGSNGRPIGYLMKSPFEFRPHGQSGLEISSLFPHTAKFADDLCVLRGMHTGRPGSKAVLRAGMDMIFTGQTGRIREHEGELRTLRRHTHKRPTHRTGLARLRSDLRLIDAKRRLIGPTRRQAHLQAHSAQRLPGIVQRDVERHGSGM